MVTHLIPTLDTERWVRN